MTLLWDLTQDETVTAAVHAGETGRAATDRLLHACACTTLRSLVDVADLPVLEVDPGHDLRRLPANLATGTPWDTAVTFDGLHDGPDVLWFDGDCLHVLDVIPGPWPAAPVTDPDTGLVVPADGADALHARARTMVLASTADDRASVGLALLSALTTRAVSQHTVRVRTDAEQVIVEVDTVTLPAPGDDR